MKLLIIGASPYQYYLYDKVRELGIEICSVDINPESAMFKKSDHYKAIDIFDTDRVVEYALEQNVDGATTINIDQGMTAVSKIQEQLGLPHKPMSKIKSCIRKDLMRNEWDKIGVQNPEYKVFTEKNDAFEYVKRLQFDSIVKPVDNAAKRGIHKIELKDSQTVKKIEDAFKNSKSGKVIIEEYITGNLYFVPTYLFEDGSVVASIIKQKFNQNHVQIQYDAPVTLGGSVKKDIINEAVKAVRTFGPGPYHTEVIYSETKGTVLVETSPRISYATVALTRLIEGFDPVSQLLNDSLVNLNLDPSTERPKDCNFARLTHIEPKAGLRFNGIRKKPDVEDGILEVTALVEKGHFVEEFKTNENRLLYFVSYGNTKQKLEKSSGQIYSAILESSFY
jgi:biotin carboxylase